MAGGAGGGGGSFTVKSGYFWCLDRMRTLHPRPNPLASVPANLWKLIWMLETPPKIKIFMWKTLHSALATMEGLFQQRSSPSPICPICKSQNESIMHLFLRCPWVEMIWFGGTLSLRPQRSLGDNWASWLLMMFDSDLGSKVERIRRLSIIAQTCWQLWKARCDFLLNNQKINPRRVMEAISSSVSTYNDSMQANILPSPLRLSSVDGVIRWSPPTQGMIKINVDESWLARDGGDFTGVVARDGLGRFLAASRLQIKASSVAQAEAMAILHGCNLGIKYGWSSVCIGSDSLVSISCLLDRSKNGNWEAFPILSKCWGLVKAFQCCRWSWVPRVANFVANLLASRNCKEACDLFWVDRPPSSLIHVLCNDGLPCPH